MSQFCVLVASSDSRKDIFDICFANADRIWADCDWPKYVGLNSAPVERRSNFRVLIAPTAGDNWCLQVKRYVDLLPSDIRYVLLMVEDVLFMKPVNAMLLDDIAHKMASAALVYLRLVPSRHNWLGRLIKRIDFCNIGPFREIDKSEPYYSSTEMVIWRRDYLLKQLSGATDAWAFEHLLSPNPHYAVLEPVFDQHQIVQKGHWNRAAPRLLRSQGLAIGRGVRPFQTWRAWLRGHWQNINFALFGYASFKLKRRMGIKT